jgi:hypothetical protein
MIRSNEGGYKVIKTKNSSVTLSNEKSKIIKQTYTSEHFSVTFTEKLSEERKVWNISLAKLSERGLNSDVETVFNWMEELSNSLDNKSSLSIINDAENAFNRYVKDSFENKKNTLAVPSKDSLFQLSRFIPELYHLQSSVYVDEDSGCFGVILKSKNKSRPILNLLMRSDKEVTFSFIKKENGLIKISGRAYFNEHLEDSKEINNLLRMLKN